MNQIDEFFDGLPSQDRQVTDPIENKPATTEQVENKPEDVKPENGDEPRKNRRHRRLEQQLQEERDARIRAEALVDARSGSTKEDTSDVDSRWLRIYGDTPETREAWKLQQDIFSDFKKTAKEEALQEIQQQQVESSRQQKEYEQFIDSQLEDIEDEFNVDVTSDSPAARKARREFLEMVQQASPKDEDGTITAYADFPSVWEFYQLKQTKDRSSSDRQKDLSSRTMNKTNGSTTTESTITPGFDGWRKDYGMN